MKIRVKWALTAAAALLVGVVVTAYAILTSLDFEDLRAVIEAETKRATGRSLRIGGPMDLKVSLSPTITIRNVTFGNADWGAWPELFSIRGLEVEVRLLPLLSGDIEVRRLVAVEPTILLETDAQGRGNWVIGGPQADPGESTGPVAIPAFHRIEVRDGRAIFRDGQSGQEILVVLDRLDAWAETPASPSTVALKGTYNGVEFVADGTLGSRDELLGGGRFPLDLQIEMGRTRLKLAGAIDDLATARGVDLQADLRGASLSDLGPVVGADLPPLGPYALTGRLRETEDGIEIAGLAATLGDSDFAGNLTVALDGARPTIVATLNAGSLDLKDFTPGSEPVAAAPGATKPGPVFSDEALPLDALLTFDARIKLSAAQAKIDRKTMISDFSLLFELNVGQLAVRDFKGNLSGGILRGEATLDVAVSDPPLTLDLEAKGFDYGHFLQGRDVTDGVDGKLDAEVRLRAAGRSLRAWAESLGGRVELTGGEGRVRSDLLSASGAGLIDMFSAWREGEDDLKLNCVVLRLPVEGGVARTEAVLIDTAAVTVEVGGEVNLGEETLDLKVTPRAKHASLMSLAVPVRVSGNLAEPSVGPDALGTVLGVAKIAGMFVNPLVAGAAIILESELSVGNPCVAAIEDGAKRKNAPGKDGESEGSDVGENRG